MMDIGEYHADIQRNCEAISPDVQSMEGDIGRQSNSFFYHFFVSSKMITSQRRDQGNVFYLLFPFNSILKTVQQLIV